jgi:single-strand DNA-binding protein
VRYTADGKIVVSVRLASGYRKRDATTREWVEATNWYRVTVFGRLAERLSEQASAGRLAKGSRLIVFGRLEATAYMDRNNQPQPSLDVIADDVLLADTRRGESDSGPGDMDTGAPAPFQAQPRQPRPASNEAADLEDLPF